MNSQVCFQAFLFFFCEQFIERPLDPDYLEARDKPKLTARGRGVSESGSEDKGLVRAALKDVKDLKRLEFKSISLHFTFHFLSKPLKAF